MASLLLSTGRACTPTPELLGWTDDAALGFDLEPELLRALVWVESRYCAHALSPKGAIGLGQLMPQTALELGVDPRDPAQNLWGAAKYLRMRYDAFGDWALALAAYNAGAGNVRRYGGVPPFGETRSFIVQVLSVYADLKRR